MVGATCVVAQPPSIRKKGVAPDSLAPHLSVPAFAGMTKTGCRNHVSRTRYHS